jgi:hypothetical protein
MNLDQWLALGTAIFLTAAYSSLVFHPRMNRWERVGYSFMFIPSIIFIASRIIV